MQLSSERAIASERERGRRLEQKVAKETKDKCTKIQMRTEMEGCVDRIKSRIETEILNSFACGGTVTDRPPLSVFLKGID